MKNISDVVAKTLAKHKGEGSYENGLSLNGLESISASVIEALCKHVGDLSLDGLKSITDANAIVLGEHKGTLSLAGLTTLSEAAARALAGHKEEVYLFGLNEASQQLFDTAKSKPKSKPKKGGKKKQVVLEFEVKRGSVNSSDCDKVTKITKAIACCEQNKHKEAAELVFPLMHVEWDWSAGNGGDTDEFFEAPYPEVMWKKKTCALQVEEEGRELIITASVLFTIQGKADMDLDKLEEFIDENSMYVCGCFTFGGLGFTRTEGDNVRVISIDGEPV